MDLLWLAAKLYNEPTLKEGFMTHFKKVMVGDQRQVSELNTARWWEKTEAEVAIKAPVSTVVTFCHVHRHVTSRFVTFQGCHRRPSHYVPGRNLA